jgi:hypothetical protein
MSTLNRLPSAKSQAGIALLPSLMFLFLAVTANLYAQTQPDTAKKAAAAPVKDSIVSITNLGTQHDSAKIKDVLAIKVITTKNIDSLNTLYVDGIAVNGLKYFKTNYADKILYFRLNDKVQDTLLKFSESSPFEKTIVAVNLGVGNGRSYISNVHLPTYIEIRQKINNVWIWISVIALVLLSISGLRYNILKDDNNLYYSLGRTQLFYWTLLVLIAYIFICFKTGTIPDLPVSVLAIIGISVSTTAVSKLVENKNKDKVPIDQSAKSEGFFLDILSDGSSINIQRFQNVAFNIFFGIIFLQKTFTNNIMPDFDQNVLILMGISSGAYAGLKNMEATKEQNQPAPQTGDDGSPPAAKPAEANASAATPTPSSVAPQPAQQPNALNDA